MVYSTCFDDVCMRAHDGLLILHLLHWFGSPFEIKLCVMFGWENFLVGAKFIEHWLRRAFIESYTVAQQHCRMRYPRIRWK